MLGYNILSTWPGCKTCRTTLSSGRIDGANAWRRFRKDHPLAPPITFFLIITNIHQRRLRHLRYD
jgi:ABC-type sugar transport system permease subunit